MTLNFDQVFNSHADNTNRIQLEETKEFIRASLDPDSEYYFEDYFGLPVEKEKLEEVLNALEADNFSEELSSYIGESGLWEEVEQYFGNID